MATSTGKTHQALIARGFQLPTYTFTSSIVTELGGESIQWHCDASLPTNKGIVRYSSTALTKKLATSEASALILSAILRQDDIGPEVAIEDDGEVLPGFVRKVTKPSLDSGEAKEVRSLCRDYGIEYLRAAVDYYSQASCATPGSGSGAPARIVRPGQPPVLARSETLGEPFKVITEEPPPASTRAVPFICGED